MKKIYLISLIMFCTLSIQVNAQYLQKYYLFQNNPVSFTCIEKCSMGGFIATANYYDSLNYCYHPLIIKFNDAGAVDWTKSIDIPITWYAGTVQEIKEWPGEGYYILGSATSSPVSIAVEGLFLIKIDYNGNSIWQHSYDTYCTYYDLFDRKMLFLNSGDILITAEQYDLRVYLLKTDHQGNALTGRYFTADTNCTLVLSYSSVELDNGDIITTGINNGMLVFKTNAALQLKWSKNFLGDTVTWFYSIKKSLDNNLIIAGDYHDSVNAKIQIALLKMDTAGVVLWEKKYTFPNNTWLHFIDFIQLQDSNFLIAFNQQSSSPYSFLLMETDKNGNLLYSKQFDTTSYSNPYSYEFYSLKEFNGDSIVIAGGSYLFKTGSQGIFNCGTINYPITESNINFNNSNYSTFMAHHNFLSPYSTNWTLTNVSVTEGDYCSILGIETKDKKNNYEIKVFPNPASTEIQLSSFNFQKGDEIIFSDATGKILFTKKISNLTSDLRLLISDFSNGIYFLEVKTKEGGFNKKVVVQH